jgi:hypothetical protein
MADVFLALAARQVVRTISEQVLAVLFDDVYPVSDVKAAIEEIVKSGKNPFPGRYESPSKRTRLSNGKELVLTYLGSGSFGNVFKVCIVAPSG